MTADRMFCRQKETLPATNLPLEQEVPGVTSIVWCWQQILEHRSVDPLCICEENNFRINSAASLLKAVGFFVWLEHEMAGSS